MEQTITQQKRRGRAMLFALAALFIGPLLLATLLFKFDIRPPGTVNKGELLETPLPLPTVAQPRLDEPGSWEVEKQQYGRWGLVYLSDKGCDARCERNLLTMRQVWETLNRDMPRVTRVWFTRDAAISQRVKLDSVLERHPNMPVIFAGTDAMKAALPDPDHWYVVDPRGFVVLRYKIDTDPRDMQKDLKKLLRHSKAG